MPAEEACAVAAAHQLIGVMAALPLPSMRGCRS